MVPGELGLGLLQDGSGGRGSRRRCLLLPAALPAALTARARHFRPGAARGPCRAGRARGCGDGVMEMGLWRWGCGVEVVGPGLYRRGYGAGVFPEAPVRPLHICRSGQWERRSNQGSRQHLPVKDSRELKLKAG